MSSSVAMTKHSGGVAEYRSSEGKAITLPYRGPVRATIQDILGGVRSTCTYVGARCVNLHSSHFFTLFLPLISCFALILNFHLSTYIFVAYYIQSIEGATEENDFHSGYTANQWGFRFEGWKQNISVRFPWRPEVIPVVVASVQVKPIIQQAFSFSQMLLFVQTWLPL